MKAYCFLLVVLFGINLYCPAVSAVGDLSGHVDKPLADQPLVDRLDKLERLLTDADRRWDDLSRKVKEQEEQLHTQDQKLAEQERLLRNQNTEWKLKLKEQVRRLQPLEQKLAEEERLVSEQGQFIQQLLADRGRKSDNYDVGSVNRAAGKRDVAPPPLPHDVKARSDDGGPLEVVISQLSQRVTQLDADLQTLQSSNSQQDVNIQDARSSTFVRWGSSQCGSSAQLVYQGTMGGSRYDQTGAAADYLCLTKSPVPSSHSIPPYYAWLVGSEYETHADRMDEDPVCAVCRSSFTTTIMIPGTNVCTHGWHLQYNGFLMSGYFGNSAASEYVCVDSALEASPDSSRNDNGKVLLFTVTQCGSLPCPPYQNSKVVTCVVCSK